MLLKLYRATQTYSWYDITLEGVDPDTGEFYPGEGKTVTVTYGYAIQPRWFQRHDGGQYSRKDGDYTETTVERVASVPEGCTTENQPTLGEWWHQVRSDTFRANHWSWLMRPRYYWFPRQLSSGTVLRSGLQIDLQNLWRRTKYNPGWSHTDGWLI